MAYNGTTAASSISNPPVLLVRGLGTLINASGAVVMSTAQPNVGGTGLWYYASVDSSTAIQAAGYFTDGRQLGMRNGDVMISVTASSVGSTSITCQVGVLGTTNSTGGYQVLTGAAIASS